MSLVKNSDNSALKPSLYSPEFEQSKAGSSIVKLNAIKMTGACFNEVFTEKTIFKLLHISSKGVITMLTPF